MDINVEIRGMKKLQKQNAQTAKDLKGNPMWQGMRDATLIVDRAAKKNLKVWKGPGTGGLGVTGNLHASIRPAVKQERSGFVGTVGSDLKYAKYQELGTRPHWVSVRHIGDWAEKRLGVRKPVFVSGVPLRYLARAVEDNRDKIFRKIGDAVTKIVRQ